jgi:Ethanolamine utilization protein EutJ (predicted chaperonin)
MFSSDVTIYSGDSRTLSISVLNKSGLAVDISGSTIKWALIQNGTSILTYDNTTSSSGITITSGSGGTFSISIDNDDTTDLNGIYTHEARVTDSGGNSAIVFEGNFTVTKSYI